MHVLAYVQNIYIVRFAKSMLKNDASLAERLRRVTQENLLRASIRSIHIQKCAQGEQKTLIGECSRLTVTSSSPAARKFTFLSDV